MHPPAAQCASPRVRPRCCRCGPAWMLLAPSRRRARPLRGRRRRQAGPQRLLRRVGLQRRDSLAGAVACLLRGIIVRAGAGRLARDRRGSLALGRWATSTGTTRSPSYGEVPYPSLRRRASTSRGYPLLYAGIVLLTRARLRSVDRRAWLDGLIGALAVAAVAVVVRASRVRRQHRGQRLMTVARQPRLSRSATCSCCRCVVGAIALSGWRSRGAAGPCWRSAR